LCFRGNGLGGIRVRRIELCCVFVQIHSF
jgi:hypothetical protein